MRVQGVKRRVVLWMATLAILLAALLPALTAAQPSPPDWSQVCTVHGSVVTSVAQTPPDGHLPEPGSDPLFSHCPYCSLHVAVLGMPPPALVGPALLLTFATLSAYIAAAPTLRLWSDALSRGPPVV